MTATRNEAAARRYREDAAYRERMKAQNKAKQTAFRRLRDRHPDEFNELYLEALASQADGETT